MIRLNRVAAYFLALGFCASAFAVTPVRFQNSPPMMQTMLTTQLQKQFSSDALKEIVVRAVQNQGSPYLIVRLRSAKFHKIESVRVNLSAAGSISTISRNYILQPQDRLHSQTAEVKCPDEAVEFISFAPNQDDFEQGIARDVAKAATDKGLNTILLLGEPANRQAYLNYMSCPNLKGNFYDGDSNPYEMVTSDDSVTSEDFQTTLKEKFRFKVTNIWLACEAFNDPMKSSLIVDAQAQKYAAGINNLLVGPSDRAAACAMKAALNGEPMTAAFQACYKQLDTSEDQWGFDGRGSDLFGQ